MHKEYLHYAILLVTVIGLEFIAVPPPLVNPSINAVRVNTRPPISERKTEPPTLLKIVVPKSGIALLPPVIAIFPFGSLQI